MFGSVKSTIEGKVVSIRQGARVRIAIESENTCYYFFVRKCSTKVGKKIKKGTKLGAI